ncbi:MAG: hypothetical protein ABI232_12655, partial [Jatrophihabitantaceae bacterium]
MEALTLRPSFNSSPWMGLATVGIDIRGNVRGATQRGNGAGTLIAQTISALSGQGASVLERSLRPIGRLLLAQQVAQPDAIVETLMTATAALGATDLVLYLIDYEHGALMPHPDALAHREHPEVATVDGSMAGRAFQSGTVMAAQRGDSWQVWVPVLERANKLGVLAMTVPVFDEEVEYFCTELGLAAA